MHAKIKLIVEKIKLSRPLILLITNDVTMDFIANGLLSLGASPIVSKSKDDMDDLIKIVDAVAVNLGTVDDKFIELANHACLLANQHNKPIIIDPVGAGASQYRTLANLNLLSNYRIDIIKGNASEVMSLAGNCNLSKGVDSLIQSNEAVQSAQWLSKQFNCAVIISGEVDWIIDEMQESQLTYGSPMMRQVTGTGCLLAAIVAVFHVVESNRFDASVYAVAFYGVCAEGAADKAGGPGSFKMRLLDALSDSAYA